MLNIFISYSHMDEKIANKLEEDLKNQNINFWIDKKSIKPGDMWLKEIDEALRAADYVLAIMTKNYLSSFMGTWEMYAALVEKLQRRVTWIPLFFDKPEDLDLPPLLKSIQGIPFFDDYDRGLLKLLRGLSKEKLKPKDLVATIEGVRSTNPFRRVRAEYFDSDYKLIARAFCEPEKEKYDLIKGRAPVVIFGGRGSGKTMILKSLIVDTAVARTKKRTYKESGLDYFGLYMKLTPGCFTISSEETIRSLGNDVARLVFVDDFNLKITKALVKQIDRCNNLSPPILSIYSQTEGEISEAIAQVIRPGMQNVPSSFKELIKMIDTYLAGINEYVRGIILNENPRYPQVSTDIESFLSDVCKIVAEKVEDLSGSKIYFLLDEYENLMPFQQTVVNTLVKLDPPYFTIKIASKFEGMSRPPITLFPGQALQEGNDYYTIELDYNLLDRKEFNKYQNLLLGITSNLLESEGFPCTNIKDLLGPPVKDDVSEARIMETLRAILRARRKDVSKLTDQEWNTQLDHMRMAVIFRLMRKRKRGKKYAGFDIFTYLSSGIVRYFLNLCGMAFYRAEEKGIDLKTGKPIPEDCQTWAAYTISEAYLEKIASNLENYGEVMQQFVMDLGDIFRERLLYHSSEPEVLTIALRDPRNLKDSPELEQLLAKGLMESVFHGKKPTKAYRPRVTSDVRPREYTLNRIYAPALQISHRPRWGRCNFSVQELTRLISPDIRVRRKEKTKLQKRQQKAKVIGPPLVEFEKKNER